MIQNHIIVTAALNTIASLLHDRLRHHHAARHAHLGLRHHGHAAHGGRRKHGGRQLRGDLVAGQLHLDELAGDGELVQIHLAVAVEVGQAPDLERVSTSRNT